MSEWTPEELAQKLKDNPDLKVAGQLYDYNSHMATEANAEYFRMTNPKPTKYHAQRTDYNGIIYATKGEAKKAQELDLRVKAGDIDFWVRQFPFHLPGRIIYRADFATFKKHGRLWEVEVIEVKMWRKATKKHKEGFFFTPEAKVKMKLFKETYPNIKITVV